MLQVPLSCWFHYHCNVALMHKADGLPLHSRAEQGSKADAPAHLDGDKLPCFDMLRKLHEALPARALLDAAKHFVAVEK